MLYNVTMLRMLALLASATALADPQVKVAVIPFVPLSGDVPNGAGDRAADILVTALKEHEALSPAVVGGDAAEDPAVRAKKGQELVTQARKELDHQEPGKALAHLQQGIAELGAGAAALEEVAILADAWCTLSRAAYQTGDDARGLKALDNALALKPEGPFPEEESSPLFHNLAAEERIRVRSLKKGSARIDSSPPGATLHIDGIEAGRTPVLVKDLVTGDHLWKVDLPSGGSVGGVVTVPAGSRARVLGAATAQGPGSGLESALMTNQLDKDSPKLLAELSSKVGAPAVAFGALHMDGSDLVLDSFLFWTNANAFVRLPKVKLDPDLMSAGQELARIATEVNGRISAGSLGVTASLPAKVADGLGSDSTEVTEFEFPAPGDANPQTESGPRTVVGAHHGPVKK